MADKLTLKQEKFVQGLIKGKSQRAAYRAAYNAKKMSDAAVDVAACRLLQNAKVALRYEQLKAKVIKRTEEKAITTAEEIIREIADIAKDDISNYLSFYMGAEGIEVNIKDSKDINTKNISEISIGRNGGFKFKRYDRDKALFKLAEMFGINELNKAKQKLAEDRFEHEKEIDAKKYW